MHLNVQSGDNMLADPTKYVVQQYLYESTLSLITMWDKTKTFDEITSFDKFIRFTKLRRLGNTTLHEFGTASLKSVARI